MIFFELSSHFFFLQMSSYYCSICHLWENNPNKSIYHCVDCKICRIGKGLGIDFFHCPTCGVCMSLKAKDHKCVERSLESDCPICGEFMFTSRKSVIFLVSACHLFERNAYMCF